MFTIEASVKLPRIWENYSVLEQRKMLHQRFEDLPEGTQKTVNKNISIREKHSTRTYFDWNCA